MAWTGKVLRVNLTSGSCSAEPLNMEWAHQYLGQRGLATHRDIGVGQQRDESVRHLGVLAPAQARHRRGTNPGIGILEEGQQDRTTGQVHLLDLAFELVLEEVEGQVHLVPEVVQQVRVGLADRA